jgi:hypothetical protein
VLADPRAQIRKRRSDYTAKQAFYRLADELRDTILVACSKCDWKAAFRRDELITCKNWYPTFRTVSDAAGRLVHDFDRVPPDDLLSLVALRRKVIIGLRFVKCLRLLQAVPLDDAHTLGRRRSL